ncbi:MAG: A/G-specific adenine glycosylase [Ruminococcus sp.]
MRGKKLAEYELNKIVSPLTEWYKENKRDLPWRKEKNPYYIWISEIMLQQTRVEAVKPYFERFIKALPTVQDVAECEEGRLLKLWEGLGYYNRVRNIQKAAVQIMDQYGGKFPDDYEKLLLLPGIGDYTAGAIASIAFNLPVPAVDGNVLRVISRLEESEEDILKQKTKSRIRRELTEIMPLESPGIFNQSLMDLGAAVCLPNGIPRCDICPLKDLCLAGQHQRTAEIPVRKKEKKRRIEEKTVLIIQDGDHMALRKRPKRGLLAGLYEFPNCEGHLSEEKALRSVRQYGLTPLWIQPLPEAKHIFSHVEWRMTGYIIKVAELEEREKKDLLFVDIQNAEENYPVPAAFGAYASYLNLRLGQEKYTGGYGE